MDIRNQALNSYQKFQAASKRIDSLESKIQNLIPQGPEKIIKNGNAISLSKNFNGTEKNCFTSAIQDIAKNEISKIKDAENIAEKLSQNDKYFLQQHDKIELIAAIHEAEQAINLFVNAKKEIINAYLKILETPL